MAKYTVELRKLITSGYNLGLATADYPIFDETYRATLNAKIKAHYYFREIGTETAGRFKFWLNNRLNEIMPYYNKLYAAEVLAINPLYNFNLTETLNRQASSQDANTSLMESTNNSEQTEDLLNVRSDTPAALLAAANLKNNLYASEAGRQDNTTEGQNTAISSSSLQAANTSLDTYTKTIAGSSGLSSSKLLLEFRKTFINIDMMIILELDDLFMGVY